MISPNVILTKDFTTMERIFFGPNNGGPRKGLTSILEDVKNDKNSIICAPGTNDTLMELDFNMPQSSHSQSYINVKFIESKELIEFFLLEKSPLESNFNMIYELFSKAGIPLDESLNKLNKYYIAFGTGDNLNDWAGPFVCTLGAANIELQNNVKIMTIGFVCGELNSIRSYSKKLYNSLGFGDEKLNSAVPKDSKLKFTGVANMRNSFVYNKGPLIRPTDAPRKRVQQDAISWNPYIRRLLESYLGKVYGGSTQRLQNRVMVFLTEDFDEILSKGLEKSTSIDIARNFQKLKEFGIQFRVPRTSTADERQKSRINKSRKILRRKLFDQYAEHQGDAAAIKEIELDYEKQLDENFYIKDSVIEMECEINSDTTEQSPAAVLDPIFKFIGALKKYANTVSTYTLFELNDSEIIKLLDEACIKAGRSLPGGGPGTPRIVFGDVAVIKKLLYLADNGKTVPSSSQYKKLFTSEELDTIDWEWYQETFKKTILERERNQNSSFKEKIDFGPFTPEYKEIQEVKDIIFLHGVKNSNVQSISFSNDIAEGALLNFSMEARQRSPYVNAFVRKAVKNDDFKIAEIVKYYEDKGVFTDNSTESSINLIKFINNLSEEDETALSGIEQRSNTNRIAKGRTESGKSLEEYVSLIVGYKQIMDELANDSTPELEVGYTDDSDVENPRLSQTYADLKEKMASLVVKINIRTLPFFNQKFYFEKDCYLFSMYNNVIRSDNDPNISKPTTFLSGHYKILGSRHFMNATEAYSEFELVKTNPERQKVSTGTKESIKKKAPADVAEQEDPPKSTPEVSKPITPNPGGLRFKNAPPTDLKGNKQTRQQIAQKKKAMDSEEVTTFKVSYSTIRGFQVETPPAMTPERQTEIIAFFATKKRRYYELAKRSNSPKGRRTWQKQWRKYKEIGEQIERAKSNNNGVIPTYDKDNKPTL